MILKVEGTGWIKIDDKMYGPFKNHMLYKGARMILSHLRNQMVADGYGAANVYPDYIHHGVGDKSLDSNDWHLESFVGSARISTTGSTTFTISGTTYNNICRFTANVSGGNALYISELGLALTNTDPTNEQDYPNAVIDRILVNPTVIKPDGSNAELVIDITISVV